MFEVSIQLAAGNPAISKTGGCSNILKVKSLSKAAVVMLAPNTPKILSLIHAAALNSHNFNSDCFTRYQMYLDSTQLTSMTCSW